MDDSKNKLELKDNQANNKSNPLLRFLLKHLLTVLLLIIILIILLVAKFRLTQQEKSFVAEKQELIIGFESEIDGIYKSGLEQTARIFSWAVRGEMTRSNLEQVDQYFNALIKEPNIIKIMLVDPFSTKIIKSTDTNDEGETITNPAIIQAERTFSIDENGAVLIVSPVMGIDSKIGILIIYIAK